MTKASGKGRGGKRPNAGRPPTPKLEPPPPDPSILELSPEQIMERGMRHFAAKGEWDEAAKIAKGLATIRARARAPAAAGKKQQAADLAQTRTGEGARFAPRPPPKLN